jgi:thiamine-triphosphatase
MAFGEGYLFADSRPSLAGFVAPASSSRHGCAARTRLCARGVSHPGRQERLFVGRFRSVCWGYAKLRRPVGVGPLACSMTACIEVERKFVLSPELTQRLLERLESTSIVSEKRRLRTACFTDTYFDVPDAWALTLRDWWLRQRELQWQLKIPWGKTPRTATLDTYRELDEFADVEAALGWSPDTALREGRIAPFARIVTERETLQVVYRGQTLNIDLDRTDYGYTVGEIEVLVLYRDNDRLLSGTSPIMQEAVASAKTLIQSFADEIGIASTETIVRGKLAEYIRRFRPEHYRALVRHRILPDAGAPMEP